MIFHLGGCALTSSRASDTKPLSALLAEQRVAVGHLHWVIALGRHDIVHALSTRCDWACSTPPAPEPSHHDDGLATGLSHKQSPQQDGDQKPLGHIHWRQALIHLHNVPLNTEEGRELEGMWKDLITGSPLRTSY
jgi:hypothetical protein